VSAGGDPDALDVTLPDVVSWARPRRWGGRARYPAAYAARRDAWATVVAHAVAAHGWGPPERARYRVAVAVYGGGKRDLDRVCTAVLDALQADGAVRDGCLVDALTAGASRSRRAGRRPRSSTWLRSPARGRRRRRPLLAGGRGRGPGDQGVPDAPRRRPCRPLRGSVGDLSLRIGQ
jgi:hypothetical protein